MNNSGKWFRYETLNTNSKCNIFCFPHAGAGASYYSKWGKSIPQDYSFYPLQYPMRENRIKEKMQDSLKETAFAIAHENAVFFSEKPSVFFGQCYGAVIAYETIAELKRMGMKQPLLLIAASAEAPGTSDEKMVFDNASNEEVADFFVKMGYMDPANTCNKMYMDFFMPVLKNDYILFQEYTVSNAEKIDSAVIALYSDEDSGTSAEKVHKWKQFTSGTFIEQKCSGGHFFLNSDNISEYFKLTDKLF